ADLNVMHERRTSELIRTPARQFACLAPRFDEERLRGDVQRQQVRVVAIKDLRWMQNELVKKEQVEEGQQKIRTDARQHVGYYRKSWKMDELRKRKGTWTDFLSPVHVPLHTSRSGPEACRSDPSRLMLSCPDRSAFNRL